MYVKGDTVYVRDGTGFHYVGTVKFFAPGEYLELDLDSVWVWDFNSYTDFPAFIRDGDFNAISWMRHPDNLVFFAPVFVTRFPHALPAEGQTNNTPRGR